MESDWLWGREQRSRQPIVAAPPMILPRTIIDEVQLINGPSISEEHSQPRAEANGHQTASVAVADFLRNLGLDEASAAQFAALGGEQLERALVIHKVNY